MKNVLVNAVVWALLGQMTHSALPQDSSAESNDHRWYRGNTHCHTLNSDGDSSPWDVAECYKKHNYDFVIITDHDFLTDVDRLNAVYGKEGDFLVIGGVEVSDRFENKAIHLNALNPARLVLPTGGAGVVETLQNNVNEIRAAGAVPTLNHPNYRWSFGAEEMRQVQNYKLFELYNGHPSVNNNAGGGYPGMEEIWDDILSTGKVVYGVASDDAHSYRDPFNRAKALPIRGWVMVKAAELTPAAIVNALDQGQFYSSTGIEIEDYQVDETLITLKVKQISDTKYRIQFIGKYGKTLQEDTENSATYRLKGDEMYVRVKIMDSNGNRAWTQPVWIN